MYYTIRQHKDVALVNMANILHRAHFSADAAILAHAALDLTSDLFTSHYTLGNIYAVSGKEAIPLQPRHVYLSHIVQLSTWYVISCGKVNGYATGKLTYFYSPPNKTAHHMMGYKDALVDQLALGT